jgi:hypothetical protein
MLGAGVDGRQQPPHLRRHRLVVDIRVQKHICALVGRRFKALQ